MSVPLVVMCAIFLLIMVRAGNLFILGAASNVIIIQNAEKRSGATLGFLEFARAGVPLTILNVLVYWICLRYF